jgi:hypothetical protein
MMLPESEVEEEMPTTEPSVVDFNQSFWEEAKRKAAIERNEAEEVEAGGNEGIKLCSTFILVVSKELLDCKDKKVCCVLCIIMSYKSLISFDR